MSAVRLSLSARRARLARARGFTLVELMIVVAMIGVLSSLAVVGYRKYVESAKLSEPISVMQGIRSAEEEFKDKAMTYLNVSQSNGYYPGTTFNDKKWAWNNPTGSDAARWATLGVSVSAPVRFGYRANAGNAGQAVSTPIEYKNPTNGASPTFALPANPWYIVQAKGDPDGNGKFAVLLASSFTNEIVINEEQ